MLQEYCTCRYTNSRNTNQEGEIVMLSYLLFELDSAQFHLKMKEKSGMHICSMALKEDSPFVMMALVAGGTLN